MGIESVCDALQSKLRDIFSCLSRLLPIVLCILVVRSQTLF